MMPALFTGLALLLGAFGPTLADWLDCALHDELQSHLPVVPLLCGWLAARAPAAPSATSRAGARRLPGLLTALGLLLFVLPVALAEAGCGVSALDRIAARMLALVAMIAAWCGLVLGPARLRALRFPLGMLIFAVPFPPSARALVETALQHGSAAVAATLFDLAGVPVYATGLLLHLPTVTLAVAPECSGLRSSLALLIATIVVGHLWLQNPRHTALLTLAVVPLALFRNGLRIFALGALSHHWGNWVLSSPLHQHAGPVMFALSLLPMGFLLAWLRRRERSNRIHRSP